MKLKRISHTISVYAVGLLCTVFLSNVRVSAQSTEKIKTAYIHEAFILSALPETQQIEADLRSYEKQLEKRLKAKMEEFQTKGRDFQENYENMSDLERADIQEELATMQESVIKFQQDAETSIQEKQKKLLLPVVEKIQKIIDEIASAGNYTYIFKADALLYAKDSEDISMVVLKRLGVDTSNLKSPSMDAPTPSLPSKNKE